MLPTVPSSSIGIGTVANPSGYKGIYAFHKYWGKKPHEPIAHLIESLTEPGQVVVDPFVGSGITGRESIIRSRRFVGIDINPIAVELTKLLIRPPELICLNEAVTRIEKLVRDEILESYTISAPYRFASHYLWDEDSLVKVWTSPRRSRIELQPTEHDLALSKAFSSYRSLQMRSPRFFSNSRINTTEALGISDILTGRAQRNIDLLIDSIKACSQDIQPALMLCLTGASGQMSKMVFAVTGRGKTTGKVSKKVEVGSWAIGYWRPTLHFEVNVWDCYKRRLSKLQKVVATEILRPRTDISCDTLDVFSGGGQASVQLGDALNALGKMPDESVDLIVADPPHGDRIPYLELSELWNSILGVPVSFDDEIVVSNAQIRQKSPEKYLDSMREFLNQVLRTLSRTGYFVLIFNVRQTNWWSAFHELMAPSNGDIRPPLSFLGYFPCKYSAGSIVQDNRQGSLNSDYAIVFGRPNIDHSGKMRDVASVPGWCSVIPSILDGGSKLV